ncbi:MAG TPA: hypothetical protein VK614_11760 [Allosphingosinicella sp.]|nr:hypothetical protein [Allosphingosinicella sp.]
MNNFILVAMLLGAQTPATPGVIMTDELRPAADPIGTCERNGRSFDLHRMMVLEDRPVDFDGPDGPLRVSIRGENILFEEVGPNARHGHYYTDVDYEIEPRDDLDIELKLAYFEGRLVLYWRETFQNRIYRQGLFSITGHEITALCSGQGGRQIER